MDRRQHNHSFDLRPKLISIDYYSLWECYVKRGHIPSAKKLEDRITQIVVVSFEICIYRCS
jgi:hypothetical protein